MRENAPKKAEEVLHWHKEPEPPVPGLYRIDTKLNVDTETHDASLDDDFKFIHTPYSEFFPDDILKELREFTETKDTASWLRTNEQIDTEYFREQSERRDIIKRDELNEYIEDIFDYQRYVADSFDSVNEPLDGFTVEEEYPLLPIELIEPNAGCYSMVYGASEYLDEFREVNQKSTLISQCVSGDYEYECVKQRSEDGMIVVIREGKAYYTPLSYVYKFKKNE